MSFERIKNFCRKNVGVVMLNAVAIAVAVQTVNSACGWLHHQPQVPDEMMKFRKF